MMHSHALALDALPARLAWRRLGRQLLLDRGNWRHHEQRLAHALTLEGAEPVQGALADWFHAAAGHGEAALSALRRGLALAQARLHPTVLRAFLHDLPQAGAAHSPWRGRCHPLATRYSVLLAPSLEAPKRQRRCPPDDSRRLVAQLLARLQSSSEPGNEPLRAQAQAEFLAHCRGARDALALLLARRALRQAGHALSVHWDEALDHLHEDEPR